MSFDKFIQDGQDPKVIEKIYGKMSDMLMQNESVSYIALQKKPAVTLLPDSIAISNKRIFLCEFTKLGLATNFEIFLWKDIKDIAFKEEIFGSKVTVIPFTGENLSIDYIPKMQARKLYQLIKEALANVNKEVETPFARPTASVQELIKPAPSVQQAEERPILPVTPLEELPPVAPVTFEKPVFEISEPIIVEPEPIQIPVSAPVVAAPIAPAIQEEEDDEITLKLKKLKTLYDKQLITQAEYESKKAEVLSQL